MSVCGKERERENGRNFYSHFFFDMFLLIISSSYFLFTIIFFIRYIGVKSDSPFVLKFAAGSLAGKECSSEDNIY